MGGLIREAALDSRGYFGIGIFHPKHSVNIGTLWRSAFSLGAAFIFTIGNRAKFQSSDTLNTYKHVPYFEFKSFGDFHDGGIPRGCRLIGIEITPGSIPLKKFSHPERAVYILGAEDHGLSPDVLEKCAATVQLPGRWCLNVAVAGSIVMTHRLMA